MPIVWKSVKKNLAKVPVTKREALLKYNIDPKTGKPFMLTLPADLHRQYDEAQYNIINMRKKEGFHIPKRQSNNIGSRDACVSSPEDMFDFGLLLGFAYGLQFDTKVPGKCFNNLEFSILALDSVIQLAWLILLPEKTPKVILAF